MAAGGLLFLLAFILAACFSLGGLIGKTPEGVARATWTSEVHPTDLPYQVETEVLSYFGDAPVLAIFGSEDPEDKAPLQAFNLSTEDEYAISILPPGPISTWSRPMVAEDKSLYFQIGDQVYRLTPEGSAAAVDLPFDEQDPVFCNWSWKGQLVCLNALMTQGFLVDQDLNVVEMPLPAYSVADESVAFYPPYRVGENAIRIVQTKASWSGGQPVVSYRDLDLETRSVTNQQIQLNFDFERTLVLSDSSVNSAPKFYTQSDEALTVFGITDDGEKILIQSLMEQKDDLGNPTDVLFWVELYDKQDERLTHIEMPLNASDPNNYIYQDYLITNWQFFEGETRYPIWPGVFDLKTGELLFDSTKVYGTTSMFTEIVPYGENWLVKSFYGVGFVNQHGLFLQVYYYPEEIVEAFEDGTYTLTQPMEP